MRSGAHLDLDERLDAVGAFYRALLPELFPPGAPGLAVADLLKAMRPVGIRARQFTDKQMAAEVGAVARRCDELSATLADRMQDYFLN